MRSRKVVFYHSPQSRSAGTLFLLEELGADYELRPLNLQLARERHLGVGDATPRQPLPRGGHHAGDR